MSTEATEAAKTEFAKQAVALAFMVIALIIMAAATNQDLVKMWRMQVAAASRQLLSSAARRAGHFSMGTELRTGQQKYSLPYQLSLMRDKAKAAYDKAKEH